MENEARGSNRGDNGGGRGAFAERPSVVSPGAQGGGSSATSESKLLLIFSGSMVSCSKADSTRKWGELGEVPSHR